VRLERIRTLLEKEILHGRTTETTVIMGLQEVSRHWYSQLIPFFEGLGYTFVHASYHNDASGNMGVAMAWPQGKCVEVSLPRLSDALATVCVSCGVILSEAEQRYTVGQCNECYDGGRPRSYGLSEARARPNVAIFARFENFVVGTYHMPCYWKTPEDMQVMNLHLSLYHAYGQRWSQGLPHVFTGDYNFLPHRSPYALATTGTVLGHWEECPHGAERLFGQHVAFMMVPMRSAYAVRDPDGKEPVTAFGSEGPESLDYIFVSKEWNVEGVRPTPRVPTPYEPCSIPSAEEPSDHFCIGALLKLR